MAPFVLAVILGVRAAPVAVPLDLDARLSPIAPRPKIENLMRREEPSTPHTTATVPSLPSLSDRVLTNNL